MEKTQIGVKLEKCGTPLREYDESFRTAMPFLGNAWKLRASGHADHKRTVLKLAFSSKLQHHRHEGFRTADLALPFKVLEGGNP